MDRTTEINISQEIIEKAVKRAIAELGKSAAQGTGGQTAAGTLDPQKDFPLGDKRPDLVRSASGLSLDEVTLEKVTAGKISFDDIKIRPETLEYQAQIAEGIGRPHLARNLRRAAEMTHIPDERVLEIYNALRPCRCTKQELIDIANELESDYGAKICATLVREAADVYENRNRLKP
jgi:propanediol dehydratase small subunit